MITLIIECINCRTFIYHFEHFFSICLDNLYPTHLIKITLGTLQKYDKIAINTNLRTMNAKRRQDIHGTYGKAVTKGLKPGTFCQACVRPLSYGFCPQQTDAVLGLGSASPSSRNQTTSCIPSQSPKSPSPDSYGTVCSFFGSKTGEVTYLPLCCGIYAANGTFCYRACKLGRGEYKVWQDSGLNLHFHGFSLTNAQVCPDVC